MNMATDKYPHRELFIEYATELKYKIDAIEYVFKMQKYVQMEGCKDLLELGVARGISTIGLLYTCKENNAHLWSVDIASEKKDDEGALRFVLRTKEYVKSLGLEKYWTFTQCDDLEYECDREYDLIFIDTSHKYDQTLLELEKFSKFIKTGKTIFLHDTHLSPDVARAIKSFMLADQKKHKSKRWIHEECGTLYGLGMLKRVA